MTQTIHICILSGQVLQNILPLGMKPINVLCLASSEQMIANNKDEQFTQLVYDLGYVNDKKNIIPLPAMPSSNFEEMVRWSEAQIELIQKSIPTDYKIVLNATGGTKLMSLALIKALEKPGLEDKVEIIYCDTFNEQLETIYPVSYTEPLRDNLLSTEEILKAHSIQIAGALNDSPKWKESIEQRKELTKHLGENMDQALGPFVGQLNRQLAGSLKENIEETSFPISIAMGTGVNSDWQYVLQLMEDSGLIKLTAPLNPRKPAMFTIENAESARYLHGIWLEEYLWFCFKEAGIQDLYCGLNINNLHGDTNIKNNELDLVAAYKNHLVIVECKTANISRQAVLNQALDKLSDLGRRSGGMLAQRWFTMARWPLENSSAEEKALAEKFRLQAKDRDVVLIEPRHLADLPNRLKQWKKTLRFPL